MNRRGFVLSTTLWLLAVAAAAAGVGFTAARLSVKASRNRVSLAKATWAREACLEMVRARFAEWAAQPATNLDGPVVRTPKALQIDSTDLGDGIWCRVGNRDGGAVVPRAFADSTGVCPRTSSGFQWRLNLNTAPPALLACIPGLTPAAIAAIQVQRVKKPFHVIEEVLQVMDRESQRTLLATFGDFSRLVTLQPPVWLIDVAGFAGAPQLAARATAVAAVGGSQLEILWREAQ